MSLLVDNLGDGTSRARILANAAGDAGILVGNGGNVLELQYTLGAGVNANATSDALFGINYGMSHGSFLSVVSGDRRCRRYISRLNITR